ncbi:hypothetical protein M5K25_000508 [Dendrobium thyrsiflorum]|uniref:Uncharacterized protein n=1 Tax=Dendrobium thyrsiflorum TaxID=117978 RepID=A0ABD0VUF4_DENTH
MASSDDRQRGLIKNKFRRSKKATVSQSSRHPVNQSQPVTQSQPSPSLPSLVASSPQYYSPDPCFPSSDVMHSTPSYPYCPPPPSHVSPPAYSYPLYILPYYPPPPSQPATGVPFTSAHYKYTFHLSCSRANDRGSFHPSKQPTHKIRDIIWSRYDAPYISWKKVPKEVREIKIFVGCPSIMTKLERILKSVGRLAFETYLQILESQASDHFGLYKKRREQNRQNRASDCGGLGSSLHTRAQFHILSTYDRCWVENRPLLNCIVIPTNRRRTNSGLMSERGEPMRSIHGFERARLQ